MTQLRTLLESLSKSKWGASALSLFTLLLVSCAHIQSEKWPLIKDVSFFHHFEANKKSEQCKALIYGQNGKELYCLDARFCWRDFDDERDYDFSGTLDCRLYPMTGSSSYPTLLQNNVNATADWQSYGRFTDADLKSLVGADASRSIVQRCWVRGMAIEIEILNVKDETGSKEIKNFDMIFTAKNDQAAIGAIAAQSP
jgi:hypothetical protein